MKLNDLVRRAACVVRGSWGVRHEDDCRVWPRGEVFITLRDARSGQVQDSRHLKNLIVRDASILIARLMKDSAEPTHGCYLLAVGSGDTGWDPMNPPAPTVTQRALYGEISRKTFWQTQFIDGDGQPSAVPTNVVDFSARFSESEAVGPLVEMGILGGNVTASTRVAVSPPNVPYDPTVNLVDFDTLVNYLTFPVINKPATSTLELTWRLTF